MLRNQNQRGAGDRVPSINRELFELPRLLSAADKPQKSLGIINCAGCTERRELDGYVFKLVPVCSSCRTERSLEILANQIERRAKQ